MLVCDKCSGKIIQGSQFCPHCGDPVTSADLPEKSIAENTVAQVNITFGYSSSKNYDRALSIAKNLPSYKDKGSDNNIIHSVTLPITEIELLINLYDMVGNWKSSRMLINGKPETKSALVYYGAGCYRERQKAYKPEQYCFGQHEYDMNIWGCKRLNMPLSLWGVGWLEYGSFDNNGIWHFDKSRIRHELELKIHENELCPVLNPARVIETLDKLPDRIDPKTNPNWEYTKSYEEIDGNYREVAKGIKPVLKKANSYIIGNYSPDWEITEDNDKESNVQTIKIELTAGQNDENSVDTSNQNSKSNGCLGVLLTFIFILLSVLYLVNIL